MTLCVVASYDVMFIFHFILLTWCSGGFTHSIVMSTRHSVLSTHHFSGFNYYVVMSTHRFVGFKYYVVMSTHHFVGFK